MKRRIALAATLGVVVVMLAVGIQAVRTYRTYGEWGFGVPETPSRIDALNRNYDKGDETSRRAVPQDFVASGQTDGGATVLAPAHASSQPTVIYVRDTHDRIWVYALVGGP